jgi:stage II sporulation protein M
LTRQVAGLVKSIGEGRLMPNLLLAAILFAVSLALGMFVAPNTSSDMLEGLDEMLGLLASLGPFGLFLVIFLNNAIKALAVIVLGIFLGLPPLLFIVVNGFIVGVLVSGLQPITGTGVILAALAPHGIIEVPWRRMG